MQQGPTRAPVGARRRRFVLEQPVETPDGFGGVLRRFVPGPVLWGAIRLVGDPERAAGGRADGVPTHRVSLRYRPGLVPGARLADGPRRFAIRAADDPDGRRRDLVCTVEEIVEAPPALSEIPAGSGGGARP